MNKLTGAIAGFALALVGACAMTTPPAVGVWQVEMNTPLGTLPATLTLNGDGSGLMAADNLGEAQVSGITYSGNSVNFEAEIEAQGQMLTLQFNGSVEGDNISGEFMSDFGAFGVSGTRQ